MDNSKLKKKTVFLILAINALSTEVISEFCIHEKWVWKLCMSVEVCLLRASKQIGEIRKKMKYKPTESGPYSCYAIGISAVN